MKRAATISITLLAAAVILMLCPSKGHAQFPRTSLIEEFTSATCKPCTTATPIINGILRSKVGRVLSIRYHQNFPKPGDPWYLANTSQNKARYDYYQTTSLPYGRLDGATTLAVTDQGQAEDRVDEALATESPAKIEVTQTRNGDHFDVTVSVTAGPDAALEGNLKLQVVVVEAHVHSDAFQDEPFNKEQDFYDIMRTMVPGPEGTDVAVEAGAKKDFTFSYQLGDGWQADQMYTIAFIQNDDTKQILQAGNSVQPVSGVEATPAMRGYELGASVPNPAKDQASISYTLGAPGHVTIDLYAIDGERVMSFDEGMIATGAHQRTIDLGGLPAGVYTYTINAGTFRASRMMTVVR